jgi:hypothetical protein
VGNNNVTPAGSVIISSHVLTIDETMHYHPLLEWNPNWSRLYANDDGALPTSKTTITLPSITSSVGSGLGHVHPGTFAGTPFSLLPSFKALIPIQYIGS